jgi:uncharacterized OB-fold protein
MRHIFILIFTLLIISCKTENNSDYVAGTIRFSDPAVDGCGWYFNFDGGGFPVTNLDKKYQEVGMKVKVIYKSAGKRQCGFGQTEYIEIKKIKQM